jgi:hypothetical protein
MAWILLVSGTGCNTSPFTIVPVSGTVLLDGQPLAGGVINFQPIVTGTATNSGPGSTARIDPEGQRQVCQVCNISLIKVYKNILSYNIHYYAAKNK